MNRYENCTWVAENFYKMESYICKTSAGEIRVEKVNHPDFGEAWSAIVFDERIAGVYSDRETAREATYYTDDQLGLIENQPASMADLDKLNAQLMREHWAIGNS